MTEPTRVLFVCHNHPSQFPGGAEIFAYELFNAMRSAEGWDAFFLARTGPQFAQPKTGTPFLPVADDPHQALVFTDSFDYFYGVQPDKELALNPYREFLESYRPDIIHFQHTIHLGYELLETTRRVLPAAPIVYTLHEFLPICFSNGQMVRPKSLELCEQATPQRCHECFPERSPQQFFLRERLAKEYLRHVDLFLSPSRFLMNRYREWGIPEQKLRYLENGRRPQSPAPARRLKHGETRSRFGFFGQFNPYKGLLVLLRAMALIEEEGTADIHLTLHGGNLNLQRQEFQDEFHALVAELEDVVTLHGSYRPEDLPKLMRNIDWVVMPSIWWENAPLVIQEAFMHGRPVICSDIGGMAEKVEHNVNGLHFRAQDAESLAATLLRAATTEGLWETLRTGIPPVFSTDEAVTAHIALYRTLLDARRSGPLLSVEPARSNAHA